LASSPFPDATRLAEEHDTGPSDLQRLAQRHLLMHFTPAAAYSSAPPLVIAGGEGPWLEDEHGRRYLDALAGLFCVQIGYSFGDEIGAVVQEQMARLPYATNWGTVHPSSIELAAKVAELAPAGLDRVFFTSSGSEANESAIKLTRQYHHSRREPMRRKFLARRSAYHGTSYGALSLMGLTGFRKDFEPLMPGVRHVTNTNRYRRPEGETEEQFTQFLLAEIEANIRHEGPETVAGSFVEPMQNAGGALVPPRGYAEGLRRICDAHGILLIADEVITGFGRLGEWFGSTHFSLQPDIITFAKGAASGYLPLGGLIASEQVAQTVLAGPAGMFTHGLTYGGHPAVCAAGLANLRIMEREKVVENVRDGRDGFRKHLDELRANELVGDIRGDGFHYTLELVTDHEQKAWNGTVSAAEFVHEHLSPALVRAGILCRASVGPDGTPLVQLSPPLVLTEEERSWLVSNLGYVLELCRASVM